MVDIQDRDLLPPDGGKKEEESRQQRATPAWLKPLPEPEGPFRTEHVRPTFSPHPPPSPTLPLRTDQKE